MARVGKQAKFNKVLKMEERRFDVKNLDRLQNPERLKDFPVDIVFNLAKLSNPHTIIDLGAGTGFFSIPFSTLIPECKIYACDISDVMIDWMKVHVSPIYNTIIPLKMEDSSVPLPDEIAEVLFMVNLHHELSNPDKTLKECYRLLKPKGKILISDWKKEHADRGPSYQQRYDTESVKKQVQENGFQYISVHTNFPNNFLIVGEKNVERAVTIKN